jgi:hypothetical protein
MNVVDKPKTTYNGANLTINDKGSNTFLDCNFFACVAYISFLKAS